MVPCPKLSLALAAKACWSSAAILAALSLRFSLAKMMALAALSKRTAKSCCLPTKVASANASRGSAMRKVAMRSRLIKGWVSVRVRRSLVSVCKRWLLMLPSGK